jgi:hypothetical protein
MRHCLSNLQSFFPKHTAFSKQAQLGITRSEESQGLHRGQRGLTEAFTALCPVERCYRLLETVARLSIVTLGPVCCAKIEVRQGLDDGIPVGYGQREGTLRRSDGLVIRTHTAELDGQKARDVSQPTTVVEGCSEGLSLAQSRQDTLSVTRGQER